ncbi:MAG: helicase-exonuclease AddAB subunit AddA [Ruminococcus sp.]|nr:helicase-exonuclease AddAB subunit AddA [Ruminococcus sp.]
MSRDWTNNQLLAIEARGGSLLVSAAAGSGKTAVLVERVIQMVTDSTNPVAIDRLLIVTYTRAAAAELKERIQRTLLELISKNPDNPWYRRQLVHLPAAHISTVDSFCGDLVREFFQRLRISGDYRIADSGELSLLKQEAIDLTLDKFYSEHSIGFVNLVEAFASARDDSRLQSNILRLYEFLRSHPFGDKWLSEKLSYYKDCTGVADSVWGRIVLDYTASAVDYSIDLTESSLNLLAMEPELYSKAADLFHQDLGFFTKLRDLLTTADWNTIASFVDTFTVGRLNARGFTDHPVKLRAASNRDIVKANVKTIQRLFLQNEEDILSDIASQHRIVETMFDCVRTFDRFYTDLKLQKNVADFSDIEHYALELLVSLDSQGSVHTTEVADIISDRFDAVMVDEYQDANEVQDLIFNSVSHNGTNLFVVGDVKQSIYGFRQAMPEIFLSRKNSLKLYTRDEDNYPAKVILERNFRSRREVTDFINFTFKALMSEQTGDLEYNEEEMLVPEAPFTPAATPCNELHLLDLTEIGDIDAAVAEARHIAKLVHKMCKDTYIKDKDGERLVEFRDVAVLMRNMSRYADIYVSELRRCNVPAYCETSTGFLTLHEIKVAVNFLRVIDNPVQDIPLLSVMMSPVYGFTPDDMAQIRCDNRKTSLYMAVKAFAEAGSIKAQHFLEDISSLRDISLTLPADLFIGALYEHTGLLATSSVTGGELAVNNLRLLMEYARNFEKGSSKGISAFVGFIDKLERNGTDLPAATVSNPEGANAIRIMTIHGSKGLEFPVCIVANTARQFSSDAKENVLLHSKLGFACKRRDDVLMCSYNTLPREAVSLEIKRSEKSEELRVLYVAMTRAKERLIMLASKKKLPSYVEKLSSGIVSGGQIPPFVVRDCTYLSDWLVMCALMHPGGKILREYAGVDEPDTFSVSDTGNFTVEIVTELSYDFGVSTSVPKSSADYEAVPSNVSQIISDRFDYVYPFETLTSLPQKVTASELAHKDSQRRFDRILATPAFLSDSPLTPAQKGTAMHTFLQYCDFERARLDVKAEADRLCASGRLTPIEAESLDLKRLYAFMHSDVIDLALSSDEYFREYRFTVNIPAGMVDDSIPDEHKDQFVILQGSVDLAIVSGDDIIVVDYKTDRVKTTDTLVDMYRKQLMLYRVAIEQTTGKRVSRCLIYSVYLSQSKEVL